MDPQEKIKAFYDETGMERDRLEQSVFKLEKLRTRQIIEENLLPEMSIADIGGASGAYAFWLQKLGHKVHLLDFAETHIEMARQQGKHQNLPLSSVTLGDARALPFPENSFDMVLLFGPLYHLQEKTDRIKCLTEAKRVLKPGGILLAATIGRYASLFDGFWRNLITDSQFEEIMNEDLKSGKHQNPTDNPEYFTDAYFHAPEDIENEMSEAGFTNFSVVAVEGFGWLIPTFESVWENETMRMKLLKYIDKTSTSPTMIGMSAHGITRAIK